VADSTDRVRGIAMSKYLALGILIAGLAVFANRAVAQEAADQPAPAGDASVLQLPDQAAAIAQEPTPDPKARGLELNADGTLTGQVTNIDPATLKLVPLHDVTVSFVQNRQIVAQARTDRNGNFTVRGLSPWNVYSVIVQSPEAFAAFSTYIRPFGAGPTEAEKPVANKDRKVNQLTFASDVRLVQQDLMGVGGGSPIQAVPLGDFQAVNGQGGPAPDQFTDAGMIGGAPGGGMGGGGGGMGGGGMGGGGGIGGALGAVGLALGAAALATDDNNVPPVASPFTP